MRLRSREVIKASGKRKVGVNPSGIISGRNNAPVERMQLQDREFASSHVVLLIGRQATNNKQLEAREPASREDGCFARGRRNALLIDRDAHFSRKPHHFCCPQPSGPVWHPIDSRHAGRSAARYLHDRSESAVLDRQLHHHHSTDMDLFILVQKLYPHTQYDNIAHFATGLCFYSELVCPVSIPQYVLKASSRATA
jgi:hypothetical protein